MKNNTPDREDFERLASLTDWDKDLLREIQSRRQKEVDNTNRDIRLMEDFHHPAENPTSDKTWVIRFPFEWE